MCCALDFPQSKGFLSVRPHPSTAEMYFEGISQASLASNAVCQLMCMLIMRPSYLDIGCLFLLGLWQVFCSNLEVSPLECTSTWSAKPVWKQTSQSLARNTSCVKPHQKPLPLVGQPDNLCIKTLTDQQMPFRPSHFDPVLTMF